MSVQLISTASCCGGCEEDNLCLHVRIIYGIIFVHAYEPVTLERTTSNQWTSAAWTGKPDNTGVIDAEINIIPKDDWPGPPVPDVPWTWDIDDVSGGEYSNWIFDPVDRYQHLNFDGCPSTYLGWNTIATVVLDVPGFGVQTCWVEGYVTSGLCERGCIDECNNCSDDYTWSVHLDSATPEGGPLQIIDYTISGTVHRYPDDQPNFDDPNWPWPGWFPYCYWKQEGEPDIVGGAGPYLPQADLDCNDFAAGWGCFGYPPGYPANNVTPWGAYWMYPAGAGDDVDGQFSLSITEFTDDLCPANLTESMPESDLGTITIRMYDDATLTTTTVWTFTGLLTLTAVP